MQRLVAITSIAFLVVLIMLFVSLGDSSDDSVNSSEDDSATAQAHVPVVPEVTNTTERAHTQSLNFEPEILPSDLATSDLATETNHEPAIPSTSSSSTSHTTNSQRSCSISINRTATATDVSRREPVGVNSVFSANDVPVYVFMEVNNADGPEREMTIRWNHLESDHVFEQTIPAGVSPTWRTWVYHIVRPQWTGRWHVEILAPGSCPVAELYFEAV